MTSPPYAMSDTVDNAFIKPSHFVVSRVISAQALILDTTHDEIRQLNEVGTFIWSMVLKSQYTFDDILSAVMKQFETSDQIARKDLNEFLNELHAAKLICFENLTS